MGERATPEHKRCEGVYPSGRQCTRRFVKYDGDCRRSCGGAHREPWVSVKTGYRRNMPCECGSGLKSKKCCMGAAHQGGR